jgi:hypothetical protein
MEIVTHRVRTGRRLMALCCFLTVMLVGVLALTSCNRSTDDARAKLESVARIVEGDYKREEELEALHDFRLKCIEHGFTFNLSMFTLEGERVHVQDWPAWTDSEDPIRIVVVVRDAMGNTVETERILVDVENIGALMLE